MNEPTAQQWPGHGLESGQAGYVQASAFVAVAERLVAIQAVDAPERQILDFLAALCRARAEGLMDARARIFMRRRSKP